MSYQIETDKVPPVIEKFGDYRDECAEKGFQAWQSLLDSIEDLGTRGKLEQAFTNEAIKLLRETVQGNPKQSTVLPGLNNIVHHLIFRSKQELKSLKEKITLPDETEEIENWYKENLGLINQLIGSSFYWGGITLKIEGITSTDDNPRIPNGFWGIMQANSSNAAKIMDEMSENTPKKIAFKRYAASAIFLNRVMSRFAMENKDRKKFISVTNVQSLTIARANITDSLVPLGNTFMKSIDTGKTAISIVILERRSQISSIIEGMITAVAGRMGVKTIIVHSPEEAAQSLEQLETE